MFQKYQRVIYLAYDFKLSRATPYLAIVMSARKPGGFYLVLPLRCVKRDQEFTVLHPDTELAADHQLSMYLGCTPIC